MNLIQVDIISIEPLQTALAGGANIRRRQIAAAYFGGDDGLAAAALKRPAEHLFGVAVAIALGRVKKVDADIQSAVYGVDGIAFVLGTPIVPADNPPKAKSNRGNLQRCAAKLSLLHKPFPFHFR